MINNPRTQWFGTAVKPARVGPYETTTERGNSKFFQYWDGNGFGLCARTPALATAAIGLGHSVTQNVLWRGLVIGFWEGPGK